MIYLNNAATSYPKPKAVTEAFVRAVNAPPCGQFRSSETEGSDIVADCKNLLGELLGIENRDRIYMTSGSTEALNTIIKGLCVPAGQIITTATEHNSVLRPLYNLPDDTGEPFILPCDESGLVAPELFEEEARKGKYRVIVLNHCSNVTGAVQDAAAFGAIAGKYGLIFVLDASQSAGCLPVAADEWQADALAFTGHKSLLGLQGTGGFYVREGVRLKPLKYGGTGLDSSRVRYEEGQYEYEAGTQNIAGIIALSEGIRFILNEGLQNIMRCESELITLLLSLLSEIRGVKIYGSRLKERGPVLSFGMDKLPPADISYILQNSFGIVTRAGFHCSPFIHRYIGSGEKGTVRISVSCFNKREDILALSGALKELI
ncbi:MAG: aminotransferase class V-fold PLP-dependent enzyme [Lachnospiraceae bacterium]|nr:aminotransferase class V-fold PLP-dependent enzyme [Lachnospiraceae bacterium]